MNRNESNEPPLDASIALRLYIENNKEAAERISKQAVTGNAANVEIACYILGLICNEKGSHAEAGMHFLKAIHVNPAFTKAMIELARLEETSDVGFSESLLTKSVYVEKENIDLYFTLGEFYERNRRPYLAAYYYKKIFNPQMPDKRPLLIRSSDFADKGLCSRPDGNYLFGGDGIALMLSDPAKAMQQYKCSFCGRMHSVMIDLA